jgi:hypothetical protein
VVVSGIRGRRGLDRLPPNPVGRDFGQDRVHFPNAQSMIMLHPRPEERSTKGQAKNL